MNEIGSEFQLDLSLCNGKGLREILPCAEDETFVFSGRTAIDYVLKDLNGRVKKAMLPSYCCDSMIEPFRCAGVEICFYNVDYFNGFSVDIKIPDDCDVVLWNNYFGFCVNYPEELFGEFCEKGGIIIEDITHSLFSKKQFGKHSHYLVASLRKWGGLVSGGYVSKLKGRFAFAELLDIDNTFVERKVKAMKMKAEYLCTNETNRKAEDKAEFLKLFSESNRFFAEKYQHISIDDFSAEWLKKWDVDYIRNKRIENGKVLYEGLETLSGITPVFKYEDMDCPLFVPVITEEAKRDIVVKKLAENGIYCPRHWPQPKADCKSELYKTEISLVCDQRYNAEDMKRIIDVLQDEVK